MPFLPTSTLPRPATDVVDVEIEGERVIYRPTLDRVACLDRVGAVVWTFLDGSGTVADLGADVADAFGVDVETATRDLTALLDDLESQGFLDRAGHLPPIEQQDVRPGFLADPPSP
jgi:hypothetical protein